MQCMSSYVTTYSRVKYLTYVRHGSFICDMTHSRVTWHIHILHVSAIRHDVFTCEISHLCATWLIYMWHDSFTCDMTHAYVTCLSHVSRLDLFTCAITQWCATCLIHVWRDAFTRDMTHSHVTWPIHIRCYLFIRDVPLSHVTWRDVTWRDVTWHIHICHDLHKWIMSPIHESRHTFTSHVTHMNGTCTHMNESCHTYEWVTPHIWMSHVTHMNESCHTYEWVMSRTCRTWIQHLAPTTPYHNNLTDVTKGENKQKKTPPRPTQTIDIGSQVGPPADLLQLCINESCNIYEWVMEQISNIWMSHVTYEWVMSRRWIRHVT